MTDFDEFDVVMLGGRPIRPEEYAQQEDQVRWEMWKSAVTEGLTLPPLYPGHIEQPCEVCGISVQVGPRQQEQVKQLAGKVLVRVLCLLDAAAEVADAHKDMPDAEFTIANLGNPYKEES